MHHVTVKGARVPALGLGTWQLEGTTCNRIVRAALDLGYRHIDTAQAYHNEAWVGQAIAESGIDRSDIFLTTKIWYDQLAGADLPGSAADSLRRLRTDYVDLLLIHWPNPRIPLTETLRALEAVRASGRARYIGVSNFTVPLLREAVEQLEVDLLCDQVEYHPFLSQRCVLEFLRGHGMMLTAYSPLARGQVVNHPVLTEIGQRYDRSAAQVALRWLVQQDGVAVIPKASREENLRSNLAVFDFALSDEDHAAISRLSGNVRLVNPAWAPAWDAA
jgi:2,5-diketo-D-gluconate reductase B